MLRRIAILLLCVTPLSSQVKLTRSGEQVDIVINGKLFTSFFFGSDAPKPYFHPLRAVNGTVVTRSFPMEQVAGEEPGEPHHRGFWFGHGDVNGIDFWLEGPGKGKIVLKVLGKLIGGPDTGSFTAEFQWQAPDGTPVLDESRTMTFAQIGAENIIDFEITLRPAAGAGKVTFGDTKNGGFAIHCVKALNVMTNSEGGKGEKEIWGKPANWVDFSGVIPDPRIDDQKLGVTMFDSPRNPKHPTFWQARQAGTLAANQFGEHDFFNDKTRNGSLTIQPGASLTFRYRVLIHGGDAVTARVAAQYKKWADKESAH